MGSGSIRHFFVHGLAGPLRAVARFQSWVSESVRSIPGWDRAEEAARHVTWPLRATADFALSAFPVLRRYEWLFETERLKSYPPVMLAGTILFMAWRGLKTTNLGHIGTDSLIYPALAIVSGFNPFLGCFSALAFAAGDLAQKLLWNDIYGTPKDLVGHYLNLDYWGSILGYTIAYSAPLLMGVAPGLASRLARQAVRVTLRKLFYRQAAATADGATPLGDGWRLFSRRTPSGTTEWAASAGNPGPEWAVHGEPMSRDEAEATVDGIRCGELQPDLPRVADGFIDRVRPVEMGGTIGLFAAVPGAGPAAAPGPQVPNFKDPKVQDALRSLREKGLLNDPNAWRSWRDEHGQPLGWRERQILGHMRGRRLLQPGNDAVLEQLLGGATTVAAVEATAYTPAPELAGPFAAADGRPTFPVAELTAGILAGGFTAAGVMAVAAPVLEIPAFDLRVNPDTGCKILEQKILREAAAGVGVQGGVGGPAAEVIGKPIGGGGGGAAAAAAGIAPRSDEARAREEQIEELGRRRAQQDYDKRQAEQNLREIEEQIARMTPEERRRFNEDADWGRDIKARIDQNRRQIADAEEGQRWTDKQLGDLGASGRTGDSGYGEIKRGGIGADAARDLDRQRYDDVQARIDEMARQAAGRSARAMREVDQARGSIADAAKGTFDQAALTGLDDTLRREARARQSLTEGIYEELNIANERALDVVRGVRAAGQIAASIAAGSPFSPLGILINGAYGGGSALLDGKRGKELGNAIGHGWLDPMIGNVVGRGVGGILRGIKGVASGAANLSDKTKWMNDPLFGPKVPAVPSIGAVRPGGPRPYSDPRPLDWGRSASRAAKPGVERVAPDGPRPYADPRPMAPKVNPLDPGRRAPADPYDFARQDALAQARLAREAAARAEAAEFQAQEAVRKARAAREAAREAEEAALRDGNKAATLKARRLEQEAREAAERAAAARGEANRLGRAANESQSNASRAREGWLDNDTRRAAERSTAAEDAARAARREADLTRNRAERELLDAQTSADAVKAAEKLEEAERALRAAQRAELAAMDRADAARVAAKHKDLMDQKVAHDMERALRERLHITNKNPTPKSTFVEDRTELDRRWIQGSEVEKQAVTRVRDPQSGEYVAVDPRMVEKVYDGQGNVIKEVYRPRTAGNVDVTPRGSRLYGEIEQQTRSGLGVRRGKTNVWDANDVGGADGWYQPGPPGLKGRHEITALPGTGIREHEVLHGLTSGAAKAWAPSTTWNGTYGRVTNLDEGVNEYFTQRHLTGSGWMDSAGKKIGDGSLAYPNQVRVAEALDGATRVGGSSPLREAMYNGDVKGLHESIGRKLNADAAAGEEFMDRLADRLARDDFRGAERLINDMNNGIAPK